MSLSSKKRWGIPILVCLLLSLAFVAPLFSDKMIIGHDTLFHISRIEAVKNALMHGDLLPSLYYGQNFGFGYATPLFYSDIFIIIPALLELIGIPLIISFKLNIFFCTFLSGCTMYYAADKIIKKRLAGTIATLLYLFCAYRITDVFVRGAMGEVMAFIFVPLVLLGIYQIVYEEKKSWPILAVGYGGLLLSHNITFIFFCAFFAIVLLINAKKLWAKKEIMLTVLKAGVITVCLVAFFLFPMLEQMKTGNYVVNDFVAATNSENYTLFFEQLFTLKMHFGLAGHEFGREYWMTTNPGIVLTLLPLLFLVFKQKRSNSSWSVILMITSYAAMILCLNFIPWQYLSFLRFMQFPWRLMIFPTCLLPLVCADYLTHVESHAKKWIGATCAIALVLGIYQLAPVLQQKTKIYNDTPYQLISDDNYSGEHGITTYYNQAELAAADYLPIHSGIDYRNYGRDIKTNNTQSTINNYIESYNNIRFSISLSNEDSFYILPLTYYKGYQVSVIDQNGKILENLAVYPDGEEFLVTFNPGSRTSETYFQISYKGTKIQTLSKLVSIGTLVILLGAWILKRKRGKLK